MSEKKARELRGREAAMAMLLLEGKVYEMSRGIGLTKEQVMLVLVRMLGAACAYGNVPVGKLARQIHLEEQRALGEKARIDAAGGRLVFP